MPRGNPPSDRGRPIVIGCHCHNLRDCPTQSVSSRRQSLTFRSVRRTANRVENVQQARSVVIRARAHVRTSTPRLSAADGRGHYVGLPPAPNGDHSKRTPKPCATLKTSRTEPAPSPYLQGDSRHRNLQWMAMGTNLCRGTVEALLYPGVRLGSQHDALLGIPPCQKGAWRTLPRS
jgi:hypothetical protein